MPLHRADLELIHSTFYGNAARRGKRTVLKLKKARADKEALWLLRGENEATITDKETWIRDDIDYLLSYYAVLEIAITSGVVAFDPDDPLFESAMECLNYPPLRRYYTRNYPFVLPERLRARQSREIKKVTAKRVASTTSEIVRQRHLFSAFLPLTASFENDDDLEIFLWILDGGRRGKWHYERLENVLEHPEEAAALLMKEETSNGRRLIQGTIKFIEFAVSLDTLLDEAADYPRFQEEMYLYYSYWFSASEDLVKRILGILSCLDTIGGNVEVPRQHFRKLRERATTVR